MNWNSIMFRVTGLILVVGVIRFTVGNPNLMVLEGTELAVVTVFFTMVFVLGLLLLTMGDGTELEEIL